MDAAANDSTVGPESVVRDNEMRRTFGLGALSVGTAVDRVSSSIGLPLLPSEVPLWAKYQTSLQLLASERDRYSELESSSYAWVRIVSNDLVKPSVEVGSKASVPRAFNAPPGWGVTYVRSSLSRRELDRLLIDGLSSASIDTDRRGLERIKLRTKAEGAKLVGLTARIRDNGLQLIGIVDRPIAARAQDPDIGYEVVEAEPQMTTRRDNIGQFKGGLSITTSSGQCTSTLIAQFDGAAHILTGGHCFDANFADFNAAPSWAADGYVVQHNGERVGTFVQSTARKQTYTANGYPWIVDVALVRLDPSSSGTNLFMWRQPGGQTATTENYYDNVLSGWGNPVDGQLICMEGASDHRNTQALGWMQTVCGLHNSVPRSLVNSNAYYYRLDPLGGVWGDRVCARDSGGLVRIPSGNGVQGLVSGLVLGGINLAGENPPANCSFHIRWEPYWVIASVVGYTPYWSRGASRLRNTRTGMCLALTYGYLPSPLWHKPCSDSSVIPWEFVPAGSTAEAEVMMINNWNYCVTRSVGALGADAYCSYQDVQKFQLVNAGSRRFRLRNVTDGAFVAQVSGDWAGMVATGGDAYELTT